MTLSNSQFDAKASTIAHAFGVRRRVEIEVMAMFAAAPRSAGIILAEYDADAGWFFDDDMRAIALCIDRECKEGDRPMDLEGMAIFTRDLLTRLDLWDAEDSRPFITGQIIWGPGPLSKLFCSVVFDPAEMHRAIKRWIRVRTVLEKHLG